MLLVKLFQLNKKMEIYTRIYFLIQKKSDVDALVIEND